MDKYYQAKDYFDREKINISITIAENKLIIKPSIWTVRFFFYVFAMVCIGLGALNMKTPSFVLPVLAISVILIQVWRDFQSMNTLVICPKEEVIIIKTNNIVKMLLIKLNNKKVKIAFADVKRFESLFEYHINVLDKKHIINLKLKNKATIKIFTIQDEKHAMYLVNFLNRLVKN